MLKEHNLELGEMEHNQDKYIGVRNGKKGGVWMEMDASEQANIQKLMGCLQSYIEVMINRKMREANEQRRDQEGDSGL